MMKGAAEQIKIDLDDKACRGCQLCVDICPVKVFSFDEGKFIAQVSKEENCIGCLSCYYICPSTCITLEGVRYSKDFYTNQANVKMVSRII